jgi:hypothetical protein
MSREYRDVRSNLGDSWAIACNSRLVSKGYVKPDNFGSQFCSARIIRGSLDDSGWKFSGNLPYGPKYRPLLEFRVSEEEKTKNISPIT